MTIDTQRNRPRPEKMPTLFIGHGSPMNAVEDNEFTRNWIKLAASIPLPRLILCISAHWVTRGTAITSREHMETIHDFYGFPRELYQMKYPAPGSPGLAHEIAEIITTVKVTEEPEWGLDHGAWSVLTVMYPKADIPVLQLSLDSMLPMENHVQIGAELARLRERGVLILGSGNIVHNLGMLNMAAKPYPWAADFENYVRNNLESKNTRALIEYLGNKSASMAHPTHEHYLPLLYVIGAAGGDKPEFFNEAFFAGSISMTDVLYRG